MRTLITNTFMAMSLAVSSGFATAQVKLITETEAQAPNLQVPDCWYH